MNKFLFCTIFLALANFSFAEKVNIVVSDLLTDALEAPILSFSTGESALSLTFEGSLLAIDSIKEGKSDLAVVVVTKDNEDLLDGLVFYPLCYQSVVVSVNESNSLKELSLDDLSDIFFRGENVKSVKSWNEFGRTSTSAIEPASTSFKDNLVVELFKHTVNSTKNFADWVHVIPDTAKLESFVVSNNASISISGKPLKGVRQIPILSAGANIATLPNSQSLYAGQYPLSLCFYLVFDEKNTSKVKDIVKNLLGELSLNSIDEAGFYPVPEIFAKKIILSLDILK